MPYMVGLTGGIGSGKSTVSAYFQQLGAMVIDADMVSHALTAPNTPAEKAIIQHFGSLITTNTGRLDRAALRNHIFQHPSAKHWLESYLHPQISEHIQALQSTVTTPYALIVLPIIKADSKKRFQLDTLYAMRSPISMQIARVQARDQLSHEAIQAIITQQAYPHDWVDHIIDNSDSLAVLEQRVIQLHAEFMQAGA